MMFSADELPLNLIKSARVFRFGALSMTHEDVAADRESGHGGDEGSRRDQINALSGRSWKIF